MKKTIVIIAAIIVLALLAIALAGVYKFNYLAGQPGYDVDGNKIDISENSESEEVFPDNPESSEVVDLSEEVFPDENEPAVENQPTTEEPLPANDSRALREGVVGMDLEMARMFAEENDFLFRIGQIDGEPQAVTFDFREGRVTATVENNIVVDISVE